MPTSINPQNYVPVPLGCPPGKEGQVTIPVDFNFALGLSQLVDFSALEQKGTIRNVQSFYINNLANPDTVTISDPVTGQSLTIPFRCQGYMPLLCRNPEQLTILCGGAGPSTAIVRINFNNFYMPPYLWGAAIGTQ